MNLNSPEGGYILIDKDKTWTSFDVVNKLRYALKKHLNQKKLKVGHAGTLDPLATGLLILCYGKMTKEIDRFQSMTKEYTGLIKLGGSTPSYDLETEIDMVFPVDHISEQNVIEAAKSLIGIQLQKAPAYSARKVDGHRSYKLARAGKEVNVKEHEIEVLEFDVHLISPDTIEFRILCSKGTYIRSLAHDIGKKLNSGGHLIDLRRTAIGEYRVSEALKIQEVAENPELIFNS